VILIIFKLFFELTVLVYKKLHFSLKRSYDLPLLVLSFRICFLLLSYNVLHLSDFFSKLSDFLLVLIYLSIVAFFVFLKLRQIGSLLKVYHRVIHFHL
jgi:hypothetical protein